MVGILPNLHLPGLCLWPTICRFQHLDGTDGLQPAPVIWLWLKKPAPTWTLAGGNMDQNLRNPSSSILSRTQLHGFGPCETCPGHRRWPGLPPACSSGLELPRNWGPYSTKWSSSWVPHGRKPKTGVAPLMVKCQMNSAPLAHYPSSK